MASLKLRLFQHIPRRRLLGGMAIVVVTFVGGVVAASIILQPRSSTAENDAVRSNSHATQTSNGVEVERSEDGSVNSEAVTYTACNEDGVDNLTIQEIKEGNAPPVPLRTPIYISCQEDSRKATEVARELESLGYRKVRVK